MGKRPAEVTWMWACGPRMRPRQWGAGRGWMWPLLLLHFPVEEPVESWADWEMTVRHFVKVLHRLDVSCWVLIMQRFQTSVYSWKSHGWVKPGELFSPCEHLMCQKQETAPSYHHGLAHSEGVRSDAGVFWGASSLMSSCGNTENHPAAAKINKIHLKMCALNVYTDKAIWSVLSI